MGKRFSFIHCADLHLGEPLTGLHTGKGQTWGEAIRQATFQAFEKVVDVAIERNTDAVLIAGDVYNGENHSLAAQMAFARELYRLAEAGIPVFIVHGNHDPREAWRADIPLPPSVHIFSAEEPESIPLVKNGETVAQVYGMSYASRHIHENLANRFRKEGEAFAIGMLHTEVGVTASPYAPCTVEDLRKTGMDYWALGHVHTRQTLATDPYMVYPGNTQGLHSGETGPRGCTFVDVGAFGTIEMEFLETDVIRWMDMEIDISPFKYSEELFREITKRRSYLREKTGRPNLVRLVFTGTSPLRQAFSTEEGKAYILQTLNDKEQLRTLFCCFYGIEDRTKSAIDLEQRRELPDVVGQYLQAFDAVERLGTDEKQQLLTRVVEETEEASKFGALLQYMDDEMKARAFARAEIVGAERLLEEEV